MADDDVRAQLKRRLREINSDIFLMLNDRLPTDDELSRFIAQEKARRAYEERQDREAAYSEREMFRTMVTKTISDLKLSLKKERPAFAYPPVLAKYRPEQWGNISISGQKIEAWAEPQIKEAIPPELRPHVSWEMDWQVLVLPKARYEAVALPCLSWSFTLSFLVKVDLHLKPYSFARNVRGYKCIVEMKADDLGCLYLGPASDEREGFNTPIALLRVLAQGKFEGAGVQILSCEPPFTVFEVSGFAKPVKLHDNFRKFISSFSKKQSLAVCLAALGIIDGDTVKLVGAKWDEPLPSISQGSGQSNQAGAGSGFKGVVDKLMELGMTEADAQKAVENAKLPNNVAPEEALKKVFEKSCKIV